VLLHVRKKALAHEWKTVTLLQPPYGGSRIRPTTLRRGLEAILEIAFNTGTVTPIVSERQLIEKANIGNRQTARRILIGLEQEGWITLLTKGNPVNASRYRINRKGVD